MRGPRAPGAHGRNAGRPPWSPAAILRAGADLAVPQTCGGCGRPGIRWCRRCAAYLADAPVALRPRVDPGVPVWALGRYRGPIRQAVLGVKERDRRDLVDPLGAAVAGGVLSLARWGELPDTPGLWLVPAPTRALAARRRGGDHVTAIAEAAARRLGGRVRVAPLLTSAMGTRDSAGLDARARRQNLRGRVRLRRNAPLPSPASGSILVDDILTTGATAAESVRVLADHGITVAAVLVLGGA